MTKRKAIKTLRQIVLDEIDSYNTDLINGVNNLFSNTPPFFERYGIIYGLTQALNLIDDKHLYDVARDAEYSQLIWLDWGRKVVMC